MAAYVFDLPLPAVPVAGEATLYPVRRILVAGGGTIPYPPGTTNLHHEVELVVALSKPVFRATAAEAAGAVFGHAVGLDLTRRDLQNQAKDKGRPWCLGKAFEFSAPISPIRRGSAPILAGEIVLTVNGEVRQHGDIADMIWPIPDVIAHLSQYYHLGLGDLIFTGTPEGVGPIIAGDTLVGRIAGVGELSVAITAAD